MISESSCIAILDSGRVAKRLGQENVNGNALAFSCSQLTANRSFVFAIEEKESWADGCFEFGFIGCPSEKDQQEISECFNELPKLYVSKRDIYSNSVLIKRDYFPQSVDEMENGATLGLVIRDEKTVSFFFNSVDLGEVLLPDIFKNVNMYAFMNLNGTITQTKLLSDGNVKNKGLSVDQINNVLYNSEDDENSTNQTCSKFDNELFISLSKSLFYTPTSSLVTRNLTEPLDECIASFGKHLGQEVCSPMSFRITSLSDIFEESTRGPLAVGLELEKNELTGREFILMTPDGLSRNGASESSEQLDFVSFLNFFNNMGIGSTIECAITEDSWVLIVDNEATWKIPIGAERTHVNISLDLSFRACEVAVKYKKQVAHNLFVPEDLGPLRFHSKHGRNCSLDDYSLTACRPDASSEFSDAILMTNRRLADNEVFEIRIDSLLPQWSGSLEIGLTPQDPEKMTFPKTMTQIYQSIWMISGSAVVHNGDTIWNDYNCDFDKLAEGATVGIMRSGDGEMHVFLNGKDLGVACVNVPPGCFAICDLYGQCNKVTILHPDKGPINQNELERSLENPIIEFQSHNFVPSCGFEFNSDRTLVSVYERERETNRHKNLLFSSLSINDCRLFTIRIHLKADVKNLFESDFKIGVTNFDPLLSGLTFSEVVKNWFSCYWNKNSVFINGDIARQNYSPHLDSLVAHKAEFSVCYSIENKISFAWNKFVFAEISEPINENCYVFIDVSDCRIASIEAISRSAKKHLSSKLSVKNSRRLRTVISKPVRGFNVEECEQGFVSNPNVVISNDHKSCIKIESRASALVTCNKTLEQSHLIVFQVETVDFRLKNNFAIGVIQDLEQKPAIRDIEKQWKKQGALVATYGTFVDGNCTNRDLYLRESWLKKGGVLGLYLDSKDNLSLIVNNKVMGVVLAGVKVPCTVVLQLDGFVTGVKMISDDMREPEGESLTQSCSVKDFNEGQKELKSDKFIANCGYLRICAEVLKILRVPSKFYLNAGKKPCCYCSSCSKLRSTEACFKQGEPPKPFTLPTGWCKFNLLNKSPKGLKPNKSTWHIAYHCPQVECLRKILDSTELKLPKGDINFAKSFPLADFGDQKLREKFESMIMLSPTVKYCSQTAFCRELKFKLGERGESFKVKVALQVWIKPDSYTTSIPPDPTLVFDEDIPLTEHEWMTKEKNATFVSALLIKAELYQSSS